MPVILDSIERAALYQLPGDRPMHNGAQKQRLVGGKPRSRGFQA